MNKEDKYKRWVKTVQGLMMCDSEKDGKECPLKQKAKNKKKLAKDLGLED